MLIDGRSHDIRVLKGKILMMQKHIDPRYDFGMRQVVHSFKNPWSPALRVSRAGRGQVL